VDADSENRVRLSDENLMLAYVGGDVEAFDVLYARHKDRLYRYFVKSTGAEPIARELFQDVWTNLIQHRNTYVPSAAFTTWFYRIARNRLTDYYRRHKRQLLHEPLDEDESVAAQSAVTVIAAPLQPEELASMAEREELVNGAIASLSAAQQEAVMLKHICGLSVEEVANVTGDKTETIKSRLRYAFTQLRQQLRVNR